MTWELLAHWSICLIVVWIGMALVEKAAARRK
jgi:hypothetical protein